MTEPFRLSMRTLNQDGRNGRLLPAAFKLPWRPGGRQLGAHTELHEDLVRTRRQRIGELAGLAVARASGDVDDGVEMPVTVAAAYEATRLLMVGVERILRELADAGELSRSDHAAELAGMRRFLAADGLLEEAFTDAELSDGRVPIAPHLATSLLAYEPGGGG